MWLCDSMHSSTVIFPHALSLVWLLVGFLFFICMLRFPWVVLRQWSRSASNFPFAGLLTLCFRDVLFCIRHSLIHKSIPICLLLFVVILFHQLSFFVRMLFASCFHSFSSGSLCCFYQLFLFLFTFFGLFSLMLLSFL